MVFSLLAVESKGSVSIDLRGDASALLSAFLIRKRVMDAVVDASFAESATAAACSAERRTRKGGHRVEVLARASTGPNTDDVDLIFQGSRSNAGPKQLSLLHLKIRRALRSQPRWHGIAQRQLCHVCRVIQSLADVGADQHNDVEKRVPRIV
jgi:hypothetical protein